MEVPPYSPLAGAGERRLPQYTPVIWREEPQNPFESIKWASPVDNTSKAPHDDDLVAPLNNLSSEWNTPLRTPNPPGTSGRSRFPLVTARTFPTYNYDPWSTIRSSQVFETTYIHQPPNYTSSDAYVCIDSQARTFRLEGPFVYASKTSTLPQYQIKQQLDRTGKPSGLKLRRLRPCETRACSVPAAHVGRGLEIGYNDDDTLYTMTAFEMRGSAVSDLTGSIQITSGRTLWGGSWTKIWHITRPRGDAIGNSEVKLHGRLRRRYYEGDKTLLYSVRKGVWEDGEGTVVAREDKGILEVAGMWVREVGRRDLVVGCWVMKGWIERELRWEGE